MCFPFGDRALPLSPYQLCVSICGCARTKQSPFNCELMKKDGSLTHKCFCAKCWPDDPSACCRNKGFTVVPAKKSGRRVEVTTEHVVEGSCSKR